MLRKKRLLGEFIFWGVRATVALGVVASGVAMCGLGRDPDAARATLADAGITNDVQIDQAYRPFENCRGFYRTRVSYRGQNGQIVHARVCSGGLFSNGIIEVLTP